MVRTIAVMVASIFTAASSLSAGARAQQAPSADAAGHGLPLSQVVKFEGAEKRNCPTGAVMLMLLGSRAILTLPPAPGEASAGSARLPPLGAGVY
jgi:hypothetical protein